MGNCDLDAMELVVDDDQGVPPFLHCMPCGATWVLRDPILTVAGILKVALTHECMGEVDE